MGNSVLNITVSRYDHYAAESYDTNLWVYLHDRSLKDKVLEIRSKTTKSERDALKAKLPGITPSAICRPTRSAKNVISHTGLVCFDLDKIPPEEMSEIFTTVIKIPFVAYCGLSVSGTGFWGLIPITNKAKHSQHFEAIRLYFKSVGIDSPYFDAGTKDICRFRYQSYDESAYFNHNATVFPYIFEPPKAPVKYFNGNHTENNVFDDFNRNGDIETVLLNNGWIYQPKFDKGTRKRYTRPGKENGISADYCTERRILYVFTNATDFDSAKGYNPVNAFCILECNNDWKVCARKLKEMGFGK